MLLVNVDNIVLTSTSISLLSKLVHDLNLSFAFKDLGALHFFLGLEVFNDSSGNYLT